MATLASATLWVLILMTGWAEGSPVTLFFVDKESCIVARDFVRAKYQHYSYAECFPGAAKS